MDLNLVQLQDVIKFYTNYNFYKFIFYPYIMVQLLTEKYRPKTLDDVIGNEVIIKLIKNLDNTFPHLLFCGPPGTGKTTVSKILSQKFSKVLELNASDERGIDTIRNRIKTFTQLAEQSKLVIMDECDSLTLVAQQALRRLMEVKNVKFILICNMINKIIEPIQSRTAILKFEKIPINSFLHLLTNICNKEKILLTPSGIDALIDLSQGDFRNCLNILQGICSVSNDNFNIDDNFLYSINGIPNKKQLLKIINSIKNKNEEELIVNSEKLFSHKYDYSDIMNGLFKIIKDEDNYEYLKIIGEYQYKMNDGIFSKLQFYAMFGKMMSLT